MYTSSCSGMNTQASWKKGLLDVPVVERSREWFGEEPTSSTKAGS